MQAAAEADLDAIAAFEVDIAKVSFGDEAITDPPSTGAGWQERLASQGEIALIAAAAALPRCRSAGPGCRRARTR